MSYDFLIPHVKDAVNLSKDMLKNISSSVFANSHGLCFIFSRLTPSSISKGKQLEASNVIFHCSIEMK